MELDGMREEYDRRLESYEKLETEVKYVLEHKMFRDRIPYHQVTGRIKEFDSFIQKANVMETSEPFEDIEDICGVRVICLFLSDLNRIGKIIESNFNILKKDDKIYSEPDAFGYLSVHYIGSLPEIFKGPRYDDLKKFKFEIQLRTIAMHAWATISHYLDYKSTLAIPSHLRKDFNALSAMFYVADEHFEMFFKSSEEDKRITEGKISTPELEMEEINYNTLEAYLISTYQDRKHNDKSKDISGLVEELSRSGYKTIKQLDEILNRSKKAFETFEKEHSEGGEIKRFWDIAVVRISLGIADERFLQNSKFEEEEREKRRKYRHLVGKVG